MLLKKITIFFAVFLLFGKTEAQNNRNYFWKKVVKYFVEKSQSNICNINSKNIQILDLTNQITKKKMFHSCNKEICFYSTSFEKKINIFNEYKNNESINFFILYKHDITEKQHYIFIWQPSTGGTDILMLEKKGKKIYLKGIEYGAF